MAVDSNAAPKANGLKTLVDMVIAPNEAFESLRTAPTWGWAFIVTLVLYGLGSYLLTPALVHAIQADWPRQVAESPQLQTLSPEQQQSGLQMTLNVMHYAWAVAFLVYPLILLFQTVVLAIVNAIGKGGAGFAKLWALAANVSFVSLGLSYVVVAIIAMVRGAESFNAPVDVSTAMPSLALLAPGAGVKLRAFLAIFQPFTLWGLWLTATGLSSIGRLSRPLAWTASIVLLVISGALAAMGTK